MKKLIKMGFFIINIYYISSSNDPNITRGSECMGVGRHAIFNLLAVLILKFSNNQYIFNVVSSCGCHHAGTKSCQEETNRCICKVRGYMKIIFQDLVWINGSFIFQSFEVNRSGDRRRPLFYFY